MVYPILGIHHAVQSRVLDVDIPIPGVEVDVTNRCRLPNLTTSDADRRKERRYDVTPGTVTTCFEAAALSTGEL
jgi:hypothetical protein